MVGVLVFGVGFNRELKACSFEGVGFGVFGRIIRVIGFNGELKACSFEGLGFGGLD